MTLVTMEDEKFGVCGLKYCFTFLAFFNKRKSVCVCENKRVCDCASAYACL